MPQTITKDIYSKIEESQKYLQSTLNLLEEVKKGEISVEKLRQAMGFEHYSGFYRALNNRFKHYTRGNIRVDYDTFQQIFNNFKDPIGHILKDIFDGYYGENAIDKRYYLDDIFDYKLFEENMKKILNAKEYDVLCKRYGIDCEEMTLEEIGNQYSITRERVRQIADKALFKLSEPKNIVLSMVNNIEIEEDLKVAKKLEDLVFNISNNKIIAMQRMADDINSIDEIVQRIKSDPHNNVDDLVYYFEDSEIYNKVTDNILNCSIAECEFSKRTYNALKKAKLSTINDLLSYYNNNFGDFKNVDGIGVTCEKEIKTVLKEFELI